MRHFPLFFATEGARAVIVGDGEGAAQKFRLISRSAARISLMAEDLVPELAEAVATGRADHVTATLDPASLSGARLVIVCTGCAALDAAAADLARQAGALVNVVDRPALSDVIMPAIVDRDPVVVAIGTEGTAPVLARQIKTRLETWLEPSLGQFAAELGALRSRIAHRVPAKQRRGFWDWMLAGPRRLFAEGAEGEARARIDDALENGWEAELGGPVAIIAEGPRDHLTLAALGHLQSADLILHGAATGTAVLDLARRDAERTVVDQAGQPARWTVAFAAGQAAEAYADAQRVVWITPDPTAARAALVRRGIPAELVPAAFAPSPVVARAEDG